MDKELMYWVWLQRAAGKGANLEKLLGPFGGDVRALYEADPEERDELLRKTPSDADGWQREDLRTGGLHGGQVYSRRAEELEELRSGQLSFGGAGSRNGSPSGFSGRGESEVSPFLEDEMEGRSNPPSKSKRKKKPVAESTLQRMRKVSQDEAAEVLERCEQTGVTLLCPTDDCYPALLREIPTRPAVLYALGDVSLFSEWTLPMAMVGARDARLTSLSAASMLAEGLARAGFLIVSGGAIGTDTACHIGALNAGCPTVAVLGTGIGTKYLQQNADLRRVIAHNGVLLSEMEPGEPGSRGSFPLRNRIIAGMSVGTVVVEAAVKSGSLITSKFAEEFDRDIFVPLFPGVDPQGALAESFPSYAVPAGGENSGPKGRPSYAAAFRGTRELVERDTAHGIRCAADILAEYVGPYGMDPAGLVASGQVTEEVLTRDITDLAGVFPPRLSQAMVLRARRQLGLDLAGGALNTAPGWGPYRTASDAAQRTYTSAEFAYRRGDHPHTDGLLSTDSASADEDPQIADHSLGHHKVTGSTTESNKTSNENPDATLSTPSRPYKELTTYARSVLTCFEKDPEKPLYYDDFLALDLAPQYLLAALTELQLSGYVDLLPDEQYRCNWNGNEATT